MRACSFRWMLFRRGRGSTKVPEAASDGKGKAARLEVRAVRAFLRGWARGQ
ncbi:MAG: hypothetical protein HZB55_00875 [Deltaproteobacteria bacterium]|nr:hypothetical protein [Deltaproteobacteria bacterium]